MNLVSFDIFDTVLVRKCGAPRNIFWLMAWRLYPDNAQKRDAFYQWRLTAEAAAVRRSGDVNLSLADFYRCPEISEFGEYSAARLVELEKAIEWENLISRPHIRNLISQYRSGIDPTDKFRTDPHTICFISDMYLDSDFLTSKLLDEGCLMQGERVFVSCECKARKSDGALFRLVRDQLRPDAWQHYGDNRKSDFSVPRTMGIYAGHWIFPMTAAEYRTIKKNKGDNAPTLLAALSRSARWAADNSPIATIAADYVAPAYVAYTRFVLDQARRNGVRQLYFLSRDSYILLRAAGKMSRDYPEIELKYLFLSRRSLMLPYIADMDGNRFLKALDQMTLVRKSVASLLALLQVDESMLEKHGVSFEYDKIQNKAQEADFLNKIFSSPLSADIRAKAVAQRALLLDYFRQEGLLSGRRSAMVDVGWLGTSRLMVNSILRAEGVADVEFFYLGVRRDVLPQKYGGFSAYFSPEQLSTGGTPVIENYFSASPWPTTIGYSRDAEGIVRPVFPDGKQFKETPVTQANIAAVELISEAMTGISFDHDLLHRWALSALSAFMRLKDEIDLLPLTLCDDFERRPFVRALTPEEILESVCTAKPITAWDRASLQLTVGYVWSPLLWGFRAVVCAVKKWLYNLIFKYLICESR